MSIKDWPNYLGLNAAQGRRLAKRRLLLQDSSAGRHDSIDGVGRIVVEDGLERMGGTATAASGVNGQERRTRGSIVRSVQGPRSPASISGRS